MQIATMRRPNTRTEFLRSVFLLLHDGLADVVTSVTENHDRVDIEFAPESDDEELVEASVVVMDRHEQILWQRWRDSLEHGRGDDEGEVVAVE